MAVPVEAGADGSPWQTASALRCQGQPPPRRSLHALRRIPGREAVSHAQEREGPAEGTTFVAVENWFEELKRRVPTNENRSPCS